MLLLNGNGTQKSQQQQQQFEAMSERDQQRLFDGLAIQQKQQQQQMMVRRRSIELGKNCGNIWFLAHSSTRLKPIWEEDIPLESSEISL